MQKILDNINAGVKAGIEKAQLNEKSVQLIKKQDVLDLLEDIIKKYPLDNDDMQDAWLRAFPISLIELRLQIKSLTGESNESRNKRTTMPCLQQGLARQRGAGGNSVPTV